jgi:hypothetical protein
MMTQETVADSISKEKKRTVGSLVKVVFLLYFSKCSVHIIFHYM